MENEERRPPRISLVEVLMILAIACVVITAAIAFLDMRG